MENKIESIAQFLGTIKETFVPFTGYYEKIFYDIQLPDGTIIEQCWPNAGTIGPRTGKQYGPGECMFRISKTYPGKNNSLQMIGVETIRIRVIDSIDTILTQFDNEEVTEYIKELLCLENNEEIELLRKIVNQSNKANLSLFCRGLLDGGNIKGDIKLLITFAHILRDGSPAILKEIFYSAKSRGEILNILLRG